MGEAAIDWSLVLSARESEEKVSSREAVKGLEEVRKTYRLMLEGFAWA